MRHAQSALDSLFEVGHMEQLTVEEHQKLKRIHSDLQSMVLQVRGLVSEIEERKTEERRLRQVLPSADYTGPKFTWVKHEERSKIRKELAKLKKQLDRMG